MLYVKRKLLRLLINTQVIRGKVPIRMECAPAFNYARSPHTTEILPDFSADLTNGNTRDLSSSQPPEQEKALFSSPDANLSLDLRYVCAATAEGVTLPKVDLRILDLSGKGHLGPAVSCDMILEEGQAVWYGILPFALLSYRPLNHH